MKHKPADIIQDLQNFGEYGGVNPSIADSSTFTYLKASTMQAVFEGEQDGCHLYTRHTNPSTSYLANALAGMENSEAAYVASSGMGAITSCTLQICKTGDEIIASRTIYGGTYAFFKNFLPRLGIKVHFVDITKTEQIKELINQNTKMVYCETMSNPLLEIADLPEISQLTKHTDIQLVVDNTFTPLVIAPIELGADIVIHSLTKYINGASDAVGGVVCANAEFIAAMLDVNDGAGMLLGPVMDSVRASSILKNMRTLALRIKQHSSNALYLSKKFTQDGIKTFYPGIPSHSQHELMTNMFNEGFGYSGMLVLDVKTKENAFALMEAMQNDNVGYLAVSLGFYKTLFSAPGTSTSSEIPEEEQDQMGLSPGMVRISIGIDNDIERTYTKIKKCMKELNIL
ncbi:aminotransferase class I/II-fold pyridoxal phosphate-dependent enzyme [Flavobacteriales bacterium]|nr:aminotransferase class I/II-fold pyridoxal phosphate-dependent enzyme [Flavobacteriales bacterium]MDB2653020.1 aminotransferase class I/II-fold pyridoxal phosphate-dependent enzyme [Flavobacteriales bacterium]MDG1396192.1 aminotransferase class I/II-fold pyridoxal phosphate-dependent enzyme [Flavobacteriales bacterium]